MVGVVSGSVKVDNTGGVLEDMVLRVVAYSRVCGEVYCLDTRSWRRCESICVESESQKVD